MFSLSSNYIFEQLGHEEAAMIYFVNKQNEFIRKWGYIKARWNWVYFETKYSIWGGLYDDKYLDDKEYYIKILKDNHRMAHIYLIG